MTAVCVAVAATAVATVAAAVAVAVTSFDDILWPNIIIFIWSAN